MKTVKKLQKAENKTPFIPLVASTLVLALGVSVGVVEGADVSISGDYNMSQQLNIFLPYNSLDKPSPFRLETISPTFRSMDKLEEELPMILVQQGM